jgi:excinuclease UvrABC nuclease subunit
MKVQVATYEQHGKFEAAKRYQDQINLLQVCTSQQYVLRNQNKSHFRLISG